MRTRISWDMVWAAYHGLPDFQRARVDAMGFGAFLSIEPIRPDLPLIQVLRERWDRTSRAFLLPWGHMVPTLEDVARITGLRVDGEAVSGITLPDYTEMTQRLLDLEMVYEDSSECRTIFRTDLTRVMGLEDARHRSGETREEFIARLMTGVRALCCQDPADRERADLDLRRFLMLLLGRLLLGTKADVINCRFLSILEDLGAVGRYAWGAALLAHLLADLSTGTGRETTVAGFSPLLQVWSHLYMPMGRAEPRPETAGDFPLARRWVPAVFGAPFDYELGVLRREFRDFPPSLVRWRPYEGMTDDGQPWVVAGRPRFGRELWVHCFSEIEPLRLRLVMRTLGLPQEWIAVGEPRGVGRKTRGRTKTTDWRVRFEEQYRDWQLGGTPVVSHAPDSTEYLRRYWEVYAGRPQMRVVGDERDVAAMDTQVHLRSLEDQLAAARADLAILRTQHAAAVRDTGGASSSRGPSTGTAELEERLASAVARAEEAERALATQFKELQDALSFVVRQRQDRVLMAVELTKARKQMRVAQAEAASYRERVAELECSRDHPAHDLAAQETGLREAQTRAASAEAELTFRDRRVTELEEEVARLATAADQREELPRDVVELRVALEMERRERTRERDEFRADLLQREREVADLRAQLVLAQERLRTSEERLQRGRERARAAGFSLSASTYAGSSFRQGSEAGGPSRAPAASRGSMPPPRATHRGDEGDAESRPAESGGES